MKTQVGTHIIAELDHCCPEKINNPQFIEELLLKAARDNGATVLSYYTHEFEPQGVTTFVALAESHISVHTFPEYEYVSLDAYTCGHVADPFKMVAEVIKGFEAKKVDKQVVYRGHSFFKNEVEKS